MSTAQATTAVDDERVRITTWTFGADGEATGWHVHEYDYIVVPVSGGTFAVTGPDGDTRELIQEAGSPRVQPPPMPRASSPSTMASSAAASA